MAKITYANKIGLPEYPKGNHINQWWDDDANEVKSVVNGLDNDITELQNDSIEEAPINGSEYVRKNAAWSKLTTGTGVSEEQDLKNLISSKKVFEYELDFTPADVFFSGVMSHGSSIAENDKYIILIINDSDGGDYKNHIVLRYTKGTGRIDKEVITTTNGYYNDVHKLPATLITKSGSLLVAIEQLPGTGNHNGPVQIFRWSDISDLTTYTSTVVGNGTTERLSYSFLFEIGSSVILQARRYTGTAPYSNYYVSSDDGVSFGSTTEFITYGDTDYWVYTSQVGNNIRNRDDVLLSVNPSNDAGSANCYQYVTFLKTDFTGNFYALDGTNLGTNITGAELETNLSWGDATKNNNLYFMRAFKVFGNHIYGLGYKGTRTSGSTTITSLQMIKTDVNTGATSLSSDLTTTFQSLYEGLLFEYGGNFYYKVINALSGDMEYYKINSALTDISLIHSESGNWSSGMSTSIYGGLTADYDKTKKIVRIFRL